MKRYSEKGVVFHCGENRLVGIVAIPEVSSDTGVLILVGGPQYRVGSHRQFTLLARHLAAAGLPSFRFDFTGMGDSEGNKCEFEKTEQDLSAAIKVFLEVAPTVSRVILWGLCDAASIAMMFAYRQPRVTGIILFNPWVHDDEYSPEVKLAQYYRPFLSKKEQWRRLFAGEIQLSPAFGELGRDILALIGKRLHRLRRQKKRHSFVHEMLDGLKQFQHRVLIVLSENDLTAREFSSLISNQGEWKNTIEKPATSIITVQEADHTFSKKIWQDQIIQLTIDWVKR